MEQFVQYFYVPHSSSINNYLNGKRNCVVKFITFIPNPDDSLRQVLVVSEQDEICEPLNSDVKSE